MTGKLTFHSAKLKIKRIQADVSRNYTNQIEHKTRNKAVENTYIIPDPARDDTKTTFCLITGGSIAQAVDLQIPSVSPEQRREFHIESESSPKLHSPKYWECFINCEITLGR